MFKEAILRYKWYALGSVLLVSTVVITTLLQPSYLKEVLTAVLMNDQDEIFRVGKWLLIIAGIGLVAGLVNTIVAAKIAQGVSADIREKTLREVRPHWRLQFRIARSFRNSGRLRTETGTSRCSCRA